MVVAVDPLDADGQLAEPVGPRILDRRGAIGYQAEMQRDLWEGVDPVIDRAPRLDDLRAHGLHTLAAWRRREQGRPVPEDLVAEDMSSACIRVASVSTLWEIRRPYNGEVMVVMGSHTASFCPAPELRPFVDLDILVDNPARANRTLSESGL